MSLKGKWVLITGASSGFGAAAARAFGAEGAKLLLGARRVDRLITIGTEARKAGAAEVYYHALDVSNTPSVETFITWAKEKLPTLHVLINNAGGAVYCAAKAGELQITRALRHELLGTGIRVGTVDPGLAETEFSLVRFKGDTERAEKVYEGMKPLTAEDIAEILVWVAKRPPHVNIDELIVKPVDQADVGRVYRRETD